MIMAPDPVLGSGGFELVISSFFIAAGRYWLNSRFCVGLLTSWGFDTAPGVDCWSVNRELY
jgi:hypothetical protein